MSAAASAAASGCLEEELSAHEGLERALTRAREAIRQMSPAAIRSELRRHGATNKVPCIT